MEKEISFIEQKILYGERWIDRFCYTLQQSQQNDKSIVTDFTEMFHMKQRILAFVLTIIALVFLVSNILHELFDPLFMVSQIAYLGLHFLFFLLCYYLLIDIILKIVRIFRK